YAQVRRISMKRFAIDHSNQLLLVDDQIIPLPQKEFELFLFLFGNPGQIFPAAELYQQVWRTGETDSANTVAVHIKRLRHKLEDAGAVIGRIETVRGEGYRFILGSEARIKI
ncbi:transcriptional regulatory protein, C-terminal domain protein, partial [Hungatella hathewayi DSM 13479]